MNRSSHLKRDKKRTEMDIRNCGNFLYPYHIP